MSRRALGSIKHIGNVTASGSTTARSLSARFANVINVRDYGAVADGSTDDRTAFVDALAAASGSTVFIPEGTHRIVLTNASTQLVPLADTVIEGVGRGSVIEVFVTGAGATRVLFDINNNNFTVRNCRITVNAQLGQSWTIQLFTPGNAASNLTLDDVVVDGAVTNNAGAQSHVVHVVGWIDAENFDGLTIKGGEYLNCSRLITKTNTATSTQNRLKILDNYIHDFFAPFITTNTPAGTIGDVLIDGNTFEDNNAAVVSGIAHHIQIGSADNVRVANNHFRGVGTEAVHAEEKLTHLALVGNTVENDGDGFVFVDNNVSAQAEPSWIVISGNVMRSQTAGSNRGIELTNDGSGFPPARYITITGNVIRDYNVGIFGTAEEDAIMASDNLIQNCTTGINFVEPMLAIRDNMLVDCTTGLTATNGGVWGYHDFDNVTTFLSVTNGRVSILSYSMVLVTNLPGVTTTSVNFIAIGNQFNGLLAVHFHHSGTAHRQALREIDWNGTTLVDTDQQTSGTGVVSFVGIVDNAGQLAVSLNNTGAPALNGGRLQIRLTSGMHTA